MPRLLEEKEELRNTIRTLLYCRDEALFAVEIQKIVFFADIYATEKHCGRLTQTVFKPMMYGAYSDEIKKAIEDIESDDALIRKSGMRKGQTKKKYLYLDVPGDMPHDKYEFIEKIAIETGELSLDELTTLSKENWLYRNPTGKGKISFNDYRDALESTETDPVIGVFDQDPENPDWLYCLE